MKIAVAEDIQNRDQNGGLHVRTGGSNVKRLLDDDAPDGLNFWFVLSDHVHEGEAAFSTPRHHHTFAQVKMTTRGSSDIGLDQYVDAGDVGYFPRSAFYGPQHKESCTILALQFGFNGGHQRGKAWEDLRPAAFERLKTRGVIENGLFVETDPNTGEKKVRDSVDALYDERYRMVTGKNLVIGPEGYDAPIVMHPKAFRYFEAGSGVELKHLGQFYDWPGPDGDLRLSVVRLSSHGQFTLRADRAQVAWTLTSGLEIDGKPHPELTFLYSPRGEDGLVSGVDGVELYVVEFPRLN